MAKIAAKYARYSLWSSYQKQREGGFNFNMSSNLRKVILFLLITILIYTLSGCAASKSMDSVVETGQSKVSPEAELFNDGVTEQYDGAEVALGTKLIHTLDFTLLVSDSQQAVSNIVEETNNLNGYLVESSISADNGESTRARLVIKVPQDRMQDMSAYLESLGTVKSQNMYTEDVTSEYYDTEARLKVLQKEEERMLSFMDDESATIQDLLAIEREIAQVRQQRESLQARMNVLQNQVTYAQFNVHLQTAYNEVTTPQGTLSKAKAAFIKSINFMLQLFNWLVITFFVILPYLILFVIGYGLYRAIKKRRLSRKE